MILHLDTVSFGYTKDRLVLYDVSLSVDQGEFLVITGPNGAGKSTILKLFNGILKPTSGTVTVDALDTQTTTTSTLASHIAVTFQNPSDQIFSSSVRGEIAFGPNILGRPNADELVDRSMDLLGLKPYESKHPYDLSAAHRRLLTIASAVATDAPILAFDEPTTSLSQPERLILMQAFKALAEKERTLIVVSHDLEFFVPIMTRLIALKHGNIVHTGAPQDLLNIPSLADRAGITIPLSLRIQQMCNP